MPNHDESTNYLAYPTLMPLPEQPDGVEAQIQRLLAEKKKYTAELARVEAELQRLLAAQQTGNADNARSQPPAKPEPRQKGADNNADRPVRKPPLPEKKPAGKNRQNILGNVGDRYSGLSLDGVTPKEDVMKVRFLDTLADAPYGAADLSGAKDGSVLCWTKRRVQYIAGEGGVVGGSSCAHLFAGYTNVTSIRFNGNFNTANVRDMGWMFSDCYALTTLDLSNWDTSNVTDMDWMFANCQILKSLNLSGWNTSNVTNMRYMFDNCISLTVFDPKWLNTSCADTTDMYKGISWLTRRKWGK